MDYGRSSHNARSLNSHQKNISNFSMENYVINFQRIHVIIVGTWGIKLKYLAIGSGKLKTNS